MSRIIKLHEKYGDRQLERKTCACGKSFRRGKRSQAHWDSQKACSASCAARYGQIARAEKKRLADEQARIEMTKQTLAKFNQCNQ